MSYIETIPWAGEIEFLILNWLQVSALAIYTPVVEAGLGQRESLRTPLFEDLSRRRDKFHVEGQSSKQVVQVPDAGCQNEHVAVTVRVHALDIADYVNTVFAAVIESANER